MKIYPEIEIRPYDKGGLIVSTLVRVFRDGEYYLIPVLETGWVEGSKLSHELMNRFLMNVVFTQHFWQKGELSGGEKKDESQIDEKERIQNLSPRFTPQSSSASS